ncbi:hypothetical protein JCM21900_005875 [Sporobolomyces salmonicolor]
MADEPGLYNFDLEAYCIVCDRAIDPNRPLRPPSPPPSAFSSSATSAPPPPSNASSSARSTTSGPSAPKLKRTSSGHSTTSAGAGGGGSKGASGTALKRNRSTGRLHHAAGHRKSHSHTNLHGLAPMTTAVPPEGKGKKAAAAAVEREKGSKGDEGDAAVDKGDKPQACEPASALYCSEECRQIDEARNQLALTHLGSSNASSMSYFASSSAPPLPGHPAPSFPPMARRRSSGVSSGGSVSLAISSAGERGLSPILSAAPTSNNVNQHGESPSFPFPAVSPSLAESPTLGLSAPPMPSHSSSSSLALYTVSHSHSQSMAQALSHQGGPPPLLNFSSRRQSRGAHSSGAYSYRPSLMERVPSADGVMPSTSVPLYAGGGLMARGARSMSTNSSGSGSGFFARARSTDGIAGMGSADAPADREREGRHPTVPRPPSARSSLRSMTPISSMPSISPTRQRSAIALVRHSDHISASLRESSSFYRPSSRNASHEPPPPIVGSAPAPRARGLSFGEPTTELLYPVPTSRPLPSHRSSSSASLALLGSSLSKAHERGGSWAGLTRSESTAGLSGLVALGAMASPATPSMTPLPPSCSSTASTLIPAPSTSYRDRGAASSPSSTSSFAHSHSSARTSSSRRSTAASSDQHPPFTALSSPVGESLARTRSGSSTRVKQNLTMTPSSSHLPSASTTSELSASPNPHPSAAPPNLSHPTATANATANPNRSWSWSALHVPTYPALDVSEFRAQKDREKKQQLLEKRERDGGGRGGGDHWGSGEEGAMLPPPVPKAQRKRLFYFSDAGDAE